MAKAANSRIRKNTETDQLAVVKFMSLSSSYVADQFTDEAPAAPNVDVISTHCAHLFLADDNVYKIKRAVSYSYLDMSKLDKRRELCLRELELNQGVLPEIYLGVVPITREADGSLRIDGIGEPVEWAVHMKRFNEQDVLDNMAEEGKLSIDLAGRIGCSIAKYHAELDSVESSDGFERIKEVIVELIGELENFTSILSRTLLDQFGKEGFHNLKQSRSLLDSRAVDGFIKRCHGDLHLRNMVMHDGMPVPFDALEFDERMATTDVLYDLAFVLMDLDHRGLVQHANATFNQFLLHSDERNLSALRLLPLFLFCRAGIRAMTAAQVLNMNFERSPALRRKAWQYLDLALSYLRRKPPILIAVGGLSGAGKSTMSARLAAFLGNPPGAVHLRSDAERKIALGMEETQKLPENLYTTESSNLNYQLLSRKAALALAANQSVVVDAVFLNPEHRKHMEIVANDQCVTFLGIWLEAPEHIMKRRITQRRDDASDASVEVLSRQLKEEHGPIDWQTVSSVGTEDEVFSRIVQCVQDERDDILEL